MSTEQEQEFTPEQIAELNRDFAEWKAARDAKRAPQWERIETAPKNTAVLVASPFNAGEIRVAIHVDGWGWISLPGRYAMKPTHWMRLPDPPKL